MSVAQLTSREEKLKDQISSGISAQVDVGLLCREIHMLVKTEEGSWTTLEIWKTIIKSSPFIFFYVLYNNNISSGQNQFRI